MQARAATCSIFDEQGEAARIEFVYTDFQAGKGVATVQGRLSEAVRQVLSDKMPVFTLRWGFLSARPDLIHFILARIPQASKAGQLPPLQVKISGDVPYVLIPIGSVA